MRLFHTRRALLSATGLTLALAAGCGGGGGDGATTAPPPEEGT